MTEAVLLRFLEKGLIDVRGNDERLGYLVAAANVLSTAVGKDPAKTAPFALAAFDPLIPVADPVIVEATEALRARWKTYSNAFKETPVGVMRAILGAGLHKAATADDAVAVAFAAMARNALPHTELGDEGAIWKEIVADVEAKVDERAEREWAMPDNIEMPGFKKPEISISGLPAAYRKVNQEALIESFQKAAGPAVSIPGNGQKNTDGNAFWPVPQNNHHTQWAYEFANRMAVAVAAAIDGSTSSLSVKSPDLSAAVEAIAAASTEYMGTAMQAVSAAATGLQRRTNLLWWKEAMYSPSARGSYRRMDGVTAAALMAFDLHERVPMFSPASVSAFLEEAVMLLRETNDGKSIPLGDLVEHARQADALEPLRQRAAALAASPEGRGPLLALIGHLPAAHAIEDARFRDLTGVSPGTALTLPGWAAWLFGEFQALRATAKATPPRRRAVKA